VTTRLQERGGKDDGQISGEKEGNFRILEIDSKAKNTFKGKILRSGGSKLWKAGARNCFVST